MFVVDLSESWFVLGFLHTFECVYVCMDMFISVLIIESQTHWSMCVRVLMCQELIGKIILAGDSLKKMTGATRDAGNQLKPTLARHKDTI